MRAGVARPSPQMLTTCGKETHVPNPFKSTVMNEPNAKETAGARRRRRKQDAISIVRETEIETEIIPSSRRDSLVSLVCVFRIVREVFECRRAFRVSEGLFGFILSFRAGVLPSYLLINRNKLPP